MMTTETLDPADLSAPVVLDNVKTEAPTLEVTATLGEVEKKQDEPAKTFSQAEVDALIQKRLLKEERRISRRMEQQLQERQQSEALAVQPQREAFRDDQAFQDAQIEHLAEIKAAEKLAARERASEAEKRNESFIDKAEKATERYADFNIVVGNPALRINDEMAEFISESDVGADIAYYLGKNPMKSAEIAQLSPIKAARELNRIEIELAARPKTSLSKAPEPISPVGVRGKASSSSLPSDSDDTATWMRKEQARMRSR